MKVVFLFGEIATITSGEVNVYICSKLRGNTEHDDLGNDDK